MDKENLDEEQLKSYKRNKRFLIFGGIGVTSIIVAGIVASTFRTSIDLNDLTLEKVERGTVEVTSSASGKVVPAFEEIINSPINTSILQVYKKVGDSIEVGTPLMKLDLERTELAYKKMLDEEQMKKYQLKQLRINNQTNLSDLAMKVKVSAMKLNRMEAELRNERYLDSLGSGTTDKVRQAELAYNTGKLELEQLQQMYINGKQVKDADLKVKELEYQIFSKSLTEMKNTLEDAKLRSPRKAILTYINNQVGAQISQGQQIAIISDLSNFRLNCEIADTYGDHVAPGYKTMVKLGDEYLRGVVSNVTPLSKNGVITFSVQLDEANHKRLRSGLKTDVYITNAVKDDVLRLKNDSYYTGPGNYKFFVLEDDNRLVQRKVQLGESNFEYVEVLKGLKKGDRVAINNMEDYKYMNSIKVK